MVSRPLDCKKTDIKTINTLLAKQPDAATDEGTKALEQQASATLERLDELEKRFRNPPETRGIAYSGDLVNSRINMAQYYAGSTTGSPTPAGSVYARIARRTLDEALAAVNAFMDGELAALREAVDAAGIGLLKTGDPVSVK